jgi:hypothetical protein
MLSPKPEVAICQLRAFNCFIAYSIFLVSIKFVCRLCTIISSSLDRNFWINLRLRRGLLPEKDYYIKIPSRLTSKSLKYCLHLCPGN